jgi:hypothetical protein
MKRQYVVMGILTILLPLLSVPAVAQQRPDDEQRRLSPQERAMEALREQMKSSDDEWAVLQPRIQKVMDLKQGLMSVTASALSQASGRRFRGGGGRGGPAAMEYRQSLEDIGRTLANVPVSPAAVRRSIDAAREARAAAEEEVAAAQKDLIQLLTTEQEAILVQYGVLD